MFRLSQRSLTTLQGVDPRLQAVVKRAIEITEVDFVVVQGRRTVAQQSALYGKGRTRAECIKAGCPPEYADPQEKKVTWSMNSNHLSGRAVDLAAYVRGDISWDVRYYAKIARAMKEAAADHSVDLVWGGDWVSNKDYPHFEIRRGT